MLLQGVPEDACHAVGFNLRISVMDDAQGSAVRLFEGVEELVEECEVVAGEMESC